MSSKRKRKRRTFSEEFKRDAVNLVVVEGIKVSGNKGVTGNKGVITGNKGVRDHFVCLGKLFLACL